MIVLELFLTIRTVVGFPVIIITISIPSDIATIKRCEVPHEVHEQPGRMLPMLRLYYRMNQEIFDSHYAQLKPRICRFVF